VLAASLKLRVCVPGLPRLYSDGRARKLDESYDPVVKSVAALASYPLLSSSEFGQQFVEAKASLLIACGAYQEASTFIAEIERLGLSKESWVPDFTFSALLGKGDPQAACEYVAGVSDCAVDEEAIDMARTMLKGKEEGNKMFNAEKYVEAVAAYTTAFEAGKIPVAAAYCSIVLGNRAAAYQGLNEFLNALADCGRALAFNPWNIKALSRRATLHESIRCWDDAIKDLRSYLEIAGNSQYDLFATPQERKNALAAATDRLRRLDTIKVTQANSQVDMYRILGLEHLKEEATQSDIKKAYRALALKYHPDKANRNMPSWAPASELHDDADRLFKLIGETNAQLSDQALRRVYDETERIRAQRARHTSYERSFSRTNTWSAPTPNDFQFGQDAPWMSPNSRRSKPRASRQSSGKNYYWNF
jgi:tetratricopeptide (TPR) repeat protein